MQRAATGETLSVRALNRATLDRQLLLRRSTLSVPATLEHLVGMQAQTPHTAYVGLWTRLVDFRGEQLSDLLVDRSVVRMALMRGTIHLVTARDAWGLRPLVQPVMDRVQKGQFGKRLAGVDLDEVVAMGRAFVDEQPRTFKALGDHLLTRWPDRDRFGLEQAVRTGVPLVQVPPRGLWGRSGPIAHTSIEAWLGEPPEELPTIDTVVTRYLAAFGPASVMDAQAWCGLTKLSEVFERLRPRLVTFRDEARPRAVRPAGRAPTRSRNPGPAAVPVRLREHAAVVRRPVTGDRPRDGPRHRARRRNRSAPSRSMGSWPGRGASSASAGRRRSRSRP